MDIQSLKLDLVSKILQTNKTSVLIEVEKLFKNEPTNDWWEELPEEIQQAIIEGLNDIEKGNTYTHEQIVQEAKEKYGF